MLRISQTLALATLSGAAMAQTATFDVIESLPGGPDISQAWGVSRDGSRIVGWTGAEVDGVSDIFGLRVNDGSPEILDEIVSRDIFATSGDATAIVGMAFLERPNDPGEFDLTGWVWREGEGITDLFADLIGDFSVAWDISDDGGTVVGMTNFFRDFNGGGEFSDAFIWTPGGGIEILQHLPGQSRAEATCVSADGSVVAGYEADFDGFRMPVAWRIDDDGLIETLAPVSGSLGSDVATAISENGRFVAGFSLQQIDGGTREDLVIWDRQDDSSFVAAQTPNGFANAVPSWISDDGTVVLGTWSESPFFDFPEGVAFIWIDGVAQSLQDYLANEHDLEIPDWTLRTAKDASLDGQTIVGHALSRDRSTVYGYSVTIGGCAADLDGDGDADADDFFTYLDLFAQNDERADIDGDGDRDGDDFFAYLDLFSRGC